MDEIHHVQWDKIAFHESDIHPPGIVDFKSFYSVGRNGRRVTTELPILYENPFLKWVILSMIEWVCTAVDKDLNRHRTQILILGFWISETHNKSQAQDNQQNTPPG